METKSSDKSLVIRLTERAPLQGTSLAVWMLKTVGRVHAKMLSAVVLFLSVSRNANKCYRTFSLTYTRFKGSSYVFSIFHIIEYWEQTFWKLVSLLRRFRHETEEVLSHFGTLKWLMGLLPFLQRSLLLSSTLFECALTLIDCLHCIN